MNAKHIGEMHARLAVSYYSSYTGRSQIAGLVSRYHVTQVKSDNGKGVYYTLYPWAKIVQADLVMGRN